MNPIRSLHRPKMCTLQERHMFLPVALATHFGRLRSLLSKRGANLLLTPLWRRVGARGGNRGVPTPKAKVVSIPYQPVIS